MNGAECLIKTAADAGIEVCFANPGTTEQALEMMTSFRSAVIAGTLDPVGFFGYPNAPSRLIPEGRTVEILAGVEADICGALEALAQESGAPAQPAALNPASRPAAPSGPLTPEPVAAAISRLLPENAIVMDESTTSGFPFFAASAGAPRFTLLAHVGGAICQGLPVATGAALACPDRRVIAFQADGSAMYTAQSLRTQAREGLNVTTLLCNNRAYRILQVELARAGVAEAGPQARALTSLGNPDIDFAMLARSMGVPGVRVERGEDLVRELGRALSTPGPSLIDLAL